MEATRIFTELRTILIPYAESLDGTEDKDGRNYVHTSHVLTTGKTPFLGPTQICTSPSS